MSKTHPLCDIFCTVIDNYGDIGICWRLARQWVAEYGFRVRLWVDDLASFQRLCPAIDCALEQQSISLGHGELAVHIWPTAEVTETPGDLVIAAFACRLPESWLAAMAQRSPAPVWINLEYLTAENWAAGCHGLASPHPQSALCEHYFFPGFTAHSGGLLREAGLLARRRQFQQDPAAQHRFWQQRLGMPSPESERKMSLFSYETAAIDDLLDVLQHQTEAWRLLVPEGRASQQIAQHIGRPLAPGGIWQSGTLTVHCLPFSDQAQYDELLWACDFNIVRGEDSFVRAQWAGRPFLWHIYPQAEDAHWPKLEAFLHLFLDNSPLSGPLRALWQGFNRGSTHAEVWNAVLQQLPQARAHAEAWCERQESHADLAAQLVNFYKERLK